MFYQDLDPPVKPIPALPDDDRLGWLALAWFDGFGSRTLQKLSRRYGSNGSAAWRTNLRLLREIGCKEPSIRAFMAYRKRTNPDLLREKLWAHDVSFVLFTDDAYPPLLRHIADPPFALFLRGTADATDECVAVVGTRSNTPYGRHAASWLCNELAQAGLTIVSGLAGGIDTIAHEAALESGGRCVAVLGSGVDDETVYPRCNARLAQRIVDTGGCLVSEFPPGTLIMKHHFPLRNRIISGMCRATVIVEAAEKSGSLITAHLALEQDRDVFAVPGPITHAQSQGTNRLLLMGAIPCTAPEDVLRHLAARVPPSTKARARPLTADEQRLLALLDAPRHADEITRAFGQPVAKTNALLARLEIIGCAVMHGPHVYVRAPGVRSPVD